MALAEWSGAVLVLSLIGHACSGEKGKNQCSSVMACAAPPLTKESHSLFRGGQWCVGGGRAALWLPRRGHTIPLHITEVIIYNQRASGESIDP